MSNQGNNNRGQSDLCNVGAAWRKQSDNGNEYFAVKIEQNIRAGTWLKLFWRRDQSDQSKPALSLCGELKDGFQQNQYDQGAAGNRGQNNGNRGSYGGNGNRGNGGGGYNNGNRNNQGNRGGGGQGGGGGYQGNRNQSHGQNRGNQNSQDFGADDLSVDEIPF